jgi:4-diphosphocytidyl-2-C-methyl-D-erythritol kinase
MTALRLRAPAKLNLGLRIVGRRADGYHLLDTLYHALELADDLVASPTGGELGLAITADDARDLLPVRDDNLVLRAARAFAQRAGTQPAFHFALHKRIPHGGGLGGGSSDAAAALRLCNALAGAPLDRAALHELARGLGADVPFFLSAGSQRGRGIGDELVPEASVPSRHFLLLVPPFGCDTAAVYENHAAHWNGSFDAATVSDARDQHHKDLLLRDRFENDLTAAAERVQPGLRDLRLRARALGAPDLYLTGSGSALYLACEGEDQVAAARARLWPLLASGVRLIATRSAAAPREPQPVSGAGGGG